MFMLCFHGFFCLISISISISLLRKIEKIQNMILPYSLQICQHWLRQCFWNYLDWDEICLYICTCLTMGIDYQVL